MQSLKQHPSFVFREPGRGSLVVAESMCVCVCVCWGLAVGRRNLSAHLQVLRRHPVNQVAIGIQVPGRLTLEEVAQQLGAVSGQQVAGQPARLSVRLAYSVAAGGSGQSATQQATPKIAWQRLHEIEKRHAQEHGLAWTLPRGDEACTGASQTANGANVPVVSVKK